MVGGRIIEIAYLGNELWRLWCVDRNGDETAVKVRTGERASPLPELGTEVWWQSGKVYFNNDNDWLPKVGNSFDPRKNRPMTDRQFIESASIILHHMALENTGWRGFFRRWVISHEPLRNDAANLLRAYNLQRPMPEGTSYVGDIND